MIIKTAIVAATLSLGLVLAASPSVASIAASGKIGAPAKPSGPETNPQLAKRRPPER